MISGRRIIGQIAMMLGSSVFTEILAQGLGNDRWWPVPLAAAGLLAVVGTVVFIREMTGNRPRL